MVALFQGFHEPVELSIESSDVNLLVKHDNIQLDRYRTVTHEIKLVIDCTSSCVQEKTISVAPYEGMRPICF